MDAGDSSSNSSEMAMMTPYLHFTGGDILLFKSWAPSHGAIAGASIALLFIAVVERLLAAARGTMEKHWRQRVLALTIRGYSSETNSLDGKIAAVSPTEVDELILHNEQKATGGRRARIIAPFIVSHDVTRGLMYALQALLSYILMLAVMTFQAAYVIAIVVGLGLGEMLFGRFTISGLINH